MFSKFVVLMVGYVISFGISTCLFLLWLIYLENKKNKKYYEEKEKTEND